MDATRSDDRLNASPVRHLQPKLSAVRAQLGWSIHHTCRHMWIVHISQTQDYAHHIHVRGDASTTAAGCIFLHCAIRRWIFICLHEQGFLNVLIGLEKMNIYLLTTNPLRGLEENSHENLGPSGISNE